MWELIVLGTILGQNNLFDEVSLRPSDFSTTQLRKIWALVCELAPKGALSVVSLTEALREQGILESIGDERLHGEDYIRMISSKSDTVSFREAATRVLEDSQLRKLADLGTELIIAARDGKKKPQELIDMVMAETMKIDTREDEDPVQVAGKTFLSELYERIDATEETFHWRPWIKSLFSISSYYEDNEFVLTAGEPGTGKSSIIRWDALQGALNGKSVLIYTYENSIEETRRWMISAITGINQRLFKTPKKFTKEQLDAIAEAHALLETLPIWVHEMSSQSAEVVRRKTLRHFARTGKTDVIFVDGLYLAGGVTDYEGVSRSTQAMRSLAQEVKRPVVASTQFRRPEKGSTGPRKQNELLFAGENPVRQLQTWKLHEMQPSEVRLFPDNKDGSGWLSAESARSVVLHPRIIKNTNGEVGTGAPVHWKRHCGQFETLLTNWNAVGVPASEAIAATYPARTFTPVPKPSREDRH